MAKSMRDINALYKAIQKYVEHRSGKILVIGGIEIQGWSRNGRMLDCNGELGQLTHPTGID